MPLSSVQKQILNNCGIESELQSYVSEELNENGAQKNNSSPDFLHILCNLLKISEDRLLFLRRQLGKSLDVEGQQAILAEPPPAIITLEEEIKIYWMRSMHLWKAADLVVSSPELFNVKLSSKHVHYALTKNNLAVVEMLKWAKPQYFRIPHSYGQKLIAAISGGFIGIFLGFGAGFLGGLNQVPQQPLIKKIIFSIIYPLAGMISGSAMGLIEGSRSGFTTGNITLATELSTLASLINPFHEPAGARRYQEVQLKKEKMLFDFARHYYKNKAKNKSAI